MIFPEHELAHHYLDGLTGLELGAAAHNPFGLATRNVAPIDDYEFFAGDQIQHGVVPAPVSVWGLADAIPVPDDSESFILSSHVIEHLPNVIAAFVEWNRIVRAGGYIFVIAPLPDALPEDKGRPITSVDHIIDDYRSGHTIETHPLEGVPGGRMGHYHVLTPELLIDVVDWMKSEGMCNWELVDREDVDTKVGNGFTLVFRVGAKSTSSRDNKSLIEKPEPRSTIAARSPVPSVQQLATLPIADGPEFRIGMCGTFEVENFGDLLFPALLERLGRTYIPNLSIELFSPASGTYSFTGTPVRSIGQLAEESRNLKAIVFGGGDIARFDPAGWVSGVEGRAGYADMVVESAVAAREAGIPIVWNAPGISPGVSAAQADILTSIVDFTDYAAVRDPASAAIVAKAERTVTVAPDTGFLISTLFSRLELLPVLDELRSEFGIPELFRTAHLSPATTDVTELDVAASALARWSRDDGVPVLLLPLGPMHGEVERLTSAANQYSDVLKCLPGTLHPLEWIALLAHSETHVGSGLHGNVTAFAFGNPVVVVDRLALAKLAEFTRLSDSPVLGAWNELSATASAARLVDRNERLREISGKAQAHVRTMFETIRAGRARPNASVVPLTRRLIRWATRVDEAPTRAAEAMNQIAQASVQSKELLARRSAQLTAAHAELDRVRAEVASLKISLQVRKGEEIELENLKCFARMENRSVGYRTLAGIRQARDWAFPDQTWARSAYRKLISIIDRGYRTPAQLKRLAGSTLATSRRYSAHIKTRRWRHKPLVSILTPVFNVDEEWLLKAVDSVRRQTYSNWELCLVNDASTAAHVVPILDRLAAGDPRIRVLHRTENGGISSASADALDMARGEWIGLLDHDDELASDALLQVVSRIVDEPNLDLVYTDEDKIRPDGSHFDPVRKPAWNPGLLLSCNYITHFSVFRAELIRSVGGFRPGYDGSQDYDLLLRATERARNIAHVPHVLYHWRVIESSSAGSASAKPYAYQAAVRALRDARKRRGMTGDVEMKSPGMYRTRWIGSEHPPVTVVFATRETQRKCVTTLDRFLETTRYPSLNVVVRIDGVAPLETRIRNIPVRFQAEDRSTGVSLHDLLSGVNSPFVVTVTRPLRPIRPDWLTTMMTEMGRPDVGLVGAKLLGPDGRLLHSGWTLDPTGNPTSTSEWLTAPSINRTFYTDLSRDCLAVDHSLMLLRSEGFLGIDPIRMDDCPNHEVGLGILMAEKGWATTYAPEAAFQLSQPREFHPVSAEALEWIRKHRPDGDSLFPRIGSLPSSRLRAAG